MIPKGISHISLVTEVKGARRRRRRTHLLDDLKNRRRHGELKEDAEDRKKDGNDSLSIEHKEEIQVIFHKSIDLLISSILNSMAYGTRRFNAAFTRALQ